MPAVKSGCLEMVKFLVELNKIDLLKVNNLILYKKKFMKFFI